MAYGFSSYSIDPLADYESPMYGPMPDFRAPDYGNPMESYAAGAGAMHQGYTPMGALLLGDNVYNIAVAVMHWIRMVRPME